MNETITLRRREFKNVIAEKIHSVKKRKQFNDFFYFYAALTGLVVQTESLKATSLIHAGKFTKLLNLTTTSTEEPPSGEPKDDLKETPVVKPEDKIDEIVSSNQTAR